MPYNDPARQRVAVAAWKKANPEKVSEHHHRYDFKEEVRAKKAKRYGATRVFIGVDGEGAGEGENHRYYSMRIGNRRLQTGAPLTAEQGFDFIVNSTARGVYVIFSGNYDFTMILRSAPQEFVRDLLSDRKFIDKNGKTQTRWAKWGQYSVDYIPHKRMSIRRGNGSSVTIHDVFGFFQCPFVQALDEWDIGTPEEREIIRRGKEMRGVSDPLSEESDRYNLLEVRLLAQLMDKLDSVVRSVGLSASPYEGAGAIATSIYRTYVSVPRQRRGEDEKPPQPPDKIPAWSAYYGGRFEITAHGPIDVPVYEYDICSAYPAAMLGLPCLWHGKWVHGNDPSSTVRIGYVSWQTRNTNLGSLPHRSRQGNISFPRSGAGWYWSVEWPTDPETYDVLDCWSLRQTCECRPYGWVNNLYQARRKYKTTGRKGQSMALKLGINSLYGKLAQNVGTAPWRNPVLAGLITAQTRRWIRDAAEQCPEDIVMLATDGVYSLSPLTLPLGSDLGEWETKTLSGMHIVRPGIYFDGDGTKIKTRGIGKATVERYRQEIIDKFYEVSDHPEYVTGSAKEAEGWSVPLTYNGLVSIKLAYSQGNPDRAGYFGTLSHRLSYGLRPKRVPLSTELAQCYVDGTLRSGAPLRGEKFESTPYGKTGGRNTDDEDMMDSAPEVVNMAKQTIQEGLF